MELAVQTGPYKKFNRKEFYEIYKIKMCENTEVPTADEARTELKKIMDIEGGTGFAYFFLEYCTIRDTLLQSQIKDF